MNDERSQVIYFFDLSRDVVWQPILWTKSSSNTDVVVRVTFAEAAPPAYVKKISCYVVCGLQVAVRNLLKESYDSCRYPTSDERRRLAQRTGLTVTQVSTRGEIDLGVGHVQGR